MVTVNIPAFTNQAPTIERLDGSFNYNRLFSVRWSRVDHTGGYMVQWKRNDQGIAWDSADVKEKKLERRVRCGIYKHPFSGHENWSWCQKENPTSSFAVKQGTRRVPYGVRVGSCETEDCSTVLWSNESSVTPQGNPR